MNTLIEELKQLIITSLDLEDVTPADIDASKPLFGDGLGLDSIDALELGVAIQKKYHVKLDANSAETKQHFYSVENLAKFIQSQKQA
ncbi:MAG TPA: phosphopantetheine-binding protein [Gammaproteobacteria bacterium]|nr:phosphopantetheine-binding protein [Gammaproteobacteria bacterium]